MAGERHDRADRRHRGQQPRLRLRARHLARLLLEGLELLAQCLAHGQQCASDPLKMRLACDELIDPRRKLPLRRFANLQPKAAQDPAQAVLDIQKLGLHQLAH